MGDIELHNAADLRLSLRIPGRDFESTHFDLVLAAYEKWGTGCPGYLEGEYCFAVSDQSNGRLFLCVDRMGSRPLCYWLSGSRFAFAGDPRILLNLPGIPRRLNRGKLANLLLPRVSEARDDETFHAGILSVPEASWMTFDGKGLQRETYWKLQIHPQLVPKQEADAIAALRDVLMSAVHNRLPPLSPVTTLLSGGLDSSAITALTARCLAESNRSFLALAAVLPTGHAGSLSDEREFVDEFRSVPNVRIEYVTAPGRGPFDHIEEPAWFEVSCHQTSRHYLYEAFEDEATARGSNLILDGLWGEQGPSNYAHGYHLELAAGLNWGALPRTPGNPPKAPPISVSIEDTLRNIARDARDLLFPYRGWDPHLFMNPRMLSECDAAARPRPHWPNHQRQQLELFHQIQRKHPYRLAWDTYRRVPLRSPFRDRRVMEFCVSAPGSMKVRGGYRRCLIRTALDGILPPRLQWRTTKMPFSPDYHLRYNAQLGRAKDFVGAIGPRDPVRTIVDVDRLAKALQPADPVRGSMETLVSVPSTIYLICFLRQFPEFR